MIVVDNAVFAGFVLGGDAYHADARKTHVKDPDWHAPELVRSEFRSVANGLLRRGEALPKILAAAAISDQCAAFHRLVANEVFAVLQESPLSAYDAEYVALARRLGCQLVTTDQAVLEHYPSLAIRLEDFAGS
jgi:predicted nucleic acid-binding protein